MKLFQNHHASFLNILLLFALPLAMFLRAHHVLRAADDANHTTTSSASDNGAQDQEETSTTLKLHAPDQPTEIMQGAPLFVKLAIENVGKRERVIDVRQDARQAFIFKNIALSDNPTKDAVKRSAGFHGVNVIKLSAGDRTSISALVNESWDTRVAPGKYRLKALATFQNDLISDDFVVVVSEVDTKKLKLIFDEYLTVLLSRTSTLEKKHTALYVFENTSSPEALDAIRRILASEIDVWKKSKVLYSLKNIGSVDAVDMLIVIALDAKKSSEEEPIEILKHTAAGLIAQLHEKTEDADVKLKCEKVINQYPGVSIPVIAD